MIFGGLQKTTLIDYQGKIACVENVEEMKKREGEILEKYMRTPADCQIK